MTEQYISDQLLQKAVWSGIMTVSIIVILLAFFAYGYYQMFEKNQKPTQTEIQP